MMDLLTLIFYTVLIFIVYKLFTRILRLLQISDLESKWILITGCDTGFGNAIAKRLDSLGCNVIAACLTESGETELRKSCSNKLHTVHMDVSKPQSVKKALVEVTTILPKEKGLWGLLNNAGVLGAIGQVDWLPVEQYQKVSAVNLFGMIDVTFTFLPLVKKEQGRVVNTASIVGRIAMASGPYCVSKFGVEAFSDVLRKDMRPFNVSVSIVEPTGFLTGFCDADAMKKALTDAFENAPDAVKKEYGTEYVEEASKLLEAMPKRIDSDLSPVLNAYTHGLLGRYPCPRYTVGKGATILLLLRFFPEWIQDRLLLRGLVPAACK